MFAEQRICADTSSQCPLSFPWGNKGDLPGSPHTMSLVGFPREPISQAFRIPWIFIGNWWENQCISHMIKYTTGWESNGKKHPYYEKGMGTNLPGFSHSMDLLVFFHAMGNWWENPCMSHIMKHTTGWIYNGKNHPYYGKSMSTISQVLPIRWV